MRRRWGSVLIGLVLTVGLCEAAVRVGAPYLPDPAPWPTPETRVKAAQMDDTGCVELAFVGTSVTEAAVDPRQLGVPAYNAALPFSTVSSIAYWAEHFVLPDACPDSVVIGIPTWSSGFASTTGTGRLLHGLQNVVEFRRPEDWVGEVINRSELVRRRHQLKSLPEQWTAAYRPEQTGLIGPAGNQLGYSGRTIDTFPADTTEIEMEQFDRDALIGLVQMIRLAGADVTFMVEPARCDPFGVCPGDAVRAAILRQYEDVAMQLDVPVIDVWNDFDPDLYADTSHLNDRGTRQFTELLSTELIRLGVTS